MYDSGRQAEAIAEFEVTPEMASAGAAVVADFRESYDDWMLAEAVYRAMASSGRAASFSRAQREASEPLPSRQASAQ